MAIYYLKFSEDRYFVPLAKYWELDFTSNLVLADGNELTTPIRCYYIVSDEDLGISSEFTLTYVDDTIETINSVKSAEIDNKFYYSCKHHLIKNILVGNANPTPTPTPTPITIPYFVSNDGNDINSVNGDENNPFKTLDYAISRITDQNTIYFKEGSYEFDEKEIANSDLSLQGYGNEKVIFDGTRSLNDLKDDSINGGNWEGYETTIVTDNNQTINNKKIYRIKLNHDVEIWQLFYKRKEVINARWPSAQWDDDSVYDFNKWGHGYYNINSSGDITDNSGNVLGNGIGNHYYYENGEIVDVAHEDISLYDFVTTRQGIDNTFDISDSLINLNVGSFKSYTKVVNSQTLDNTNQVIRLSYDNVDLWKEKHHYYYLENKLEYLNSENEWFFDNDSKYLYVWLENDEIPDLQNIRAKVQSYSLNVTADNVSIENINFFSTTIKGNNADNLKVNNCNFMYSSCYAHMLNQINYGTTINPLDNEVFNSQTNIKSSSNVVISKCAFRYTDGSVLEITGGNTTIEDCYFNYIDKTVCNLSSVMTTLRLSGSNNLIKNNTIHKTAASSTLNSGNQAIIEYNDLYESGYLQSDGAMIHSMVNQQPNVKIRYNWVHDTIKYGIRFDGNGEGYHGYIHHNIGWNCEGGIMVKGGELDADGNSVGGHFVYNNTFFNSVEKNDIMVLNTQVGININYGSVVLNNLCESLSGHRTDLEPFENWIINSNNYTPTNVEDYLVDVNNNDFRPINDSSIVNAGTTTYTNTEFNPSGVDSLTSDIGAMNYNGNSWVAGITWNDSSLSDSEYATINRFNFYTELEPTPTPIECVSSPVTITVESEYIGPGNSIYKYTTSDSNGNGGLFGCIDVERGSTLTIFVDGDEPNLVSHPLKITNYNDQGQAMAPVDGVVKTDLTSGPTEDHTYSLTWVIPCDETITKYQYQCENHAHMRGTINVIGECPTPTPPPTPTPTPTNNEQEPIDDYIYDSMEAVSIIGGPDGNSVVGDNDRSLTTIQGVNGVTGLTLENNIVTLTETGRYYIKARSNAYRPHKVFTRMRFLSGDYANETFDGISRFAWASEPDEIVSETSVVVDITQTTTFKIQTNVESAYDAGIDGGATLFVQKLASSTNNTTNPPNAILSARISSNGTIVSQKPEWIESCTRTAPGNYEIVYKSLYFTEIPSITVTADVLDGVSHMLAEYNNSTIHSVTINTVRNNDLSSEDTDFTIIGHNIDETSSGGSSSGSSSTGLGVVAYGAVTASTSGAIFDHKSDNIQSITRNSVGQYTITLNTELTNYNVHVITQGSSIASAFLTAKNTNNFNIRTRRIDHANNIAIADVDAPFNFVVISEDAVIGGSTSASSGSSTFASLTDTPSELSAGKYIKVNDAGDGIEFVDAPSGGGGGSASFGLIASKMDGILFEGELPDIIFQKDSNDLEAALILQTHISDTNKIQYAANTAGTNRILRFDNSATAGNMTNNGTWTLGSNSPGAVSVQHFIDTGKAVYLGGSSSSNGSSTSGGSSTPLISSTSHFKETIVTTKNIPDALVVNCNDNKVCFILDQVTSSNLKWSISGTGSNFYIRFTNVDDPVFSDCAYPNHGISASTKLFDLISDGTLEAVNFGGSSSSGSSSSTFASLTDTPSELSAGKYIKVNDTGDGIEFVDAPSSCDPFELVRTTLHIQSDTTDGDSNVFDLYGFETISNNGVVHATADVRSNFGSTNLKFDNNYLFVPSQSKLDFVNNDFTIDFWYYKRNHNTAGDIDTIFTIEKNTHHLTGNWSFELYTLPDGTYQMIFDCTDGTFSDITVSSSNVAKIVDQTWNYITITRSGDDVYLYVNGVVADTVDLAGKQVRFDTSMYLTIGGRNGANISSMYLQDFRIRKGVSDVNPDVPTELVSVSCDGGGSSSSGSSSSTFASLTDTPSELSAGKYIKVNDTGDGIEFVDAPSGGSGSSLSGVEIGNADVFKDKSNFNGTLPSVIYATSSTYMCAMLLTDLDELAVTNAPTGRIYYRFPYGNWWLEFSNDSEGTALAHNGISHQSVNGSQLSSLKEYIDNGYATFLGSGATSSSSNGSSSSISTTEFCKCNFEATNVGHGGHDISVDDTTLTNESSNWIYTDTTNNITGIRPPSNGLYNISSYLHVFGQGARWKDSVTYLDFSIWKRNITTNETTNLGLDTENKETNTSSFIDQSINEKFVYLTTDEYIYAKCGGWVASAGQSTFWPISTDLSNLILEKVNVASSSSVGSSSGGGAIVLEANKTDSTTIVHGNEVILKCNAVTSDLHSAYDASTGIFTAPHDMDIIMTASVAVDTYITSSLYLKLVNLTQNKIFGYSSDTSLGQVVYRVVNTTGIHKVNAGDQLAMKVNVYSNSNGMQFVPKNVNLSIGELNVSSSSSSTSSQNIPSSNQDQFKIYDL